MDTIQMQPQLALELAERLFDQGKLSESEQLFRQLTGSADCAADAYHGIGAVNLERGDLRAAELNFRSAIERNPKHANALYWLGEIDEKKGLSEEAISYYRAAVAMNPQHARAQGKLARWNAPLTGSSTSLVRDGKQPGYGIFEFLQQDGSSLSRQALSLMDSLKMSVVPRRSAYLGRLLMSALFTLFPLWGFVFGFGVGAHLAFGPKLVVVSFLIIGPVLISIFNVRRITIDKGRLQIEKGISGKRLANVDLWRVHNIDLHRSLLNRLTGDGTLRFTGPGVHVNVTGLAAGKRLDEIFQQLLNLVFALRTNAAIKGIIS